MSQCKCFSEMIEKVKDQLMDQIPEDAVEVDFSWENTAFFPSGGDYSPVNPRVKIEYRKPKKGGGHAKNLTKDSISILCNYCPFCGRKYEKNQQDKG